MSPAPEINAATPCLARRSIVHETVPPPAAPPDLPGTTTRMLSERLTSSELFVEGITPSRYWGDQWLRVAEKVLRGLNQELGARLATLDTAVGMLRPGQGTNPALASSFSEEVAGLYRLLGLYRAMTAEALAHPEVTRVQELAHMVAVLHEHHPDLRSVRCVVSGDPDTDPVFVKQAALLRCMLVLVASVSGNTLRAGEGGAMRVEYGVEESDVYVRIRGSAPRDQLLFSGEGSLLHASRAALVHAHASVDGVIRRDGAVGHLEYEIRLPRLTAA